LLLLHANAVVVDGAAFAFCGPSGAGKSTLAAYFQGGGYRVLCDDVCAIRFDVEGRPFACPGVPRLKLWGDAATALGHDPTTLELVIEGHTKYTIPLLPGGMQPVPLRQIYLLERSDPGQPSTITRLRGARAMEALFAQTYRGSFIAPMGLAARHFRQCADLLAHAEVHIAARGWGHDIFARETDRLERHMRGARVEELV
jgi:hypothetical protein